ncbi:MAG: hypothetical protein Q4B28_06255 [bacterium]|nr:hypothetical protein [bacterium]
MQHFGIGKLFARLSKPTPGKDEHHTLFDSKKLDRLLDLKNSPDLLKDPEY